MITYSLAEVRNGTGWTPGVKFYPVDENGTPGQTAYTLPQIRGATGWSRDTRFVTSTGMKKIRSFSAQKAALTRVVKGGDRDALVAEVRRVKAEWNQVGWPDDWARWNRALQDVFGWPAPDMDEL